MNLQKLTPLLTFPQIAINEYSKNIGKSKDIMEHYIGVLATEGVTFVPIWTEPPDVPEKVRSDISTNKI